MESSTENILPDRRLRIGYDEDDDDDEVNNKEGYEEEEEPFDCYDPAAAEAAARKYSPWTKNNNINNLLSSSSEQTSLVRRSPPSSSDGSSTTSTNSGSPSRPSPPKPGKPRPWRVDVMLKKTKGVERASDSWKQEMKVRKQVFESSGVTVTEEEGVFDGIQSPSPGDDGEDDLSEKATIGHGSPAPENTCVISDRMDPNLAPNPTFMQRLDGTASTTSSRSPAREGPADSSRSTTSTTATTESSSSRNPATDICHDLEKAIQTLDEPQLPSRSLQWQAADSSFEKTGDSPLRPRLRNPRIAGGQMENSPPRTVEQRDDRLVPGSTSSGSGANLSSLREVGTTNDANELEEDTDASQTQQQQQQQQSLSEPVFTDLVSALEQYALPSIVRRAWSDDSDDGISVGSVRSIASSHYNQEAHQAETNIDHRRRRLIETLEATFVPIDESMYTITALGQSHPSNAKDPNRNEYLIAYARFQRSRFVTELKSTTGLISTRNFECIDKTKEDWEREAEEWRAKQEYAKTGNVSNLLAVLSADQTTNIPQQEEPVMVETVTSIETASISSFSFPQTPTATTTGAEPDAIVVETVMSTESSSVASPVKVTTTAATTAAAAATTISESEPLVVETVMSMETVSTTLPSPVKASSALPSGRSETSSSMLVNTVLSMDESESPLFSPLSELGGMTPLNAHIAEKTPIHAISPPSNSVGAEAASPATQVVSPAEMGTTDVCDPVSVPDPTTVKAVVETDNADNDNNNINNADESSTTNKESIADAVAEPSDPKEPTDAPTVSPAEMGTTDVCDPVSVPDSTFVKAVVETDNADNDNNNINNADESSTTNKESIADDVAEPSDPKEPTDAPTEQANAAEVDVHPAGTTENESQPATTTTAATPTTSAVSSTDDKMNDDKPDEVVISSSVVSPTPESPKKSKASKWRDRLAKRKSYGGKKALELPTGVLESIDPESNEKIKGPESAEPMKHTESTGPIQDSRPVSPETEDDPGRDETSPEKSRRKSEQWKQRLAERKKKTSPDRELVVEEDPLAAASTATEKDNEQKLAMSEGSHVVASAKVLSDTKIAPALPETTSTVAAKPQPNQVETKPPSVPTTAPKATGGDTVKAAAAAGGLDKKDLRTSFMAFEALLQQRPGIQDVVRDADEYSEYTIEESVIHPEPPPKSAMNVRNVERTPNKASNDFLYEEITVDQSYMEFTVYDPNDQRHNVSTPVGQQPSVPSGSADFKTSRMFSTPQVAQEPIITLYRHADDDEMTQLTFDQSYAGMAIEEEAPMPVPTSVGKERKRLSENSSGKGSAKQTIGDLHRSDSSAQSNSRKLGSSNSRKSAGSRGAASATNSEKDSKRVAELLRKDIWSRDAKVVEEALDCIVIESAKGSKYRAKIAQCGGIMGIIRAMESHTTAEPVQSAGCKALHRMAMDSSTQVIIGEMGGIATILDAMTAFPKNVEVHMAACAALASITRHRGTTDEAVGVVPVLCASMTQHPKNMHVQSKAFGIIANLCMDNKARLSELSEAGGMLAMTMALQQPWPSKKEKHDAISNLSILLRCMAEHEEGDNGEEDDGYGEGDDLDELMSVVSQLEEEMSLHPDDDYGNETDYGDEGGMVGYEAEPTHGQGFGQVDSLEKIGRKAEGSDATQPTVPTGREGEDENCIIS